MTSPVALEPLQKHASKVATPAEAVRRIPAGRRILIGSGAAEPVSMVEALVKHGDHLADNEVVHLLTLGPAPYVAPEFADRIRHTAFFIGPNVRDAVAAGRADFMPVFLSEIPELIRTRRVRVDVAIVQVSPPDAHGYVSLGVSVDIVRAAVDSASLVIAEVNPNMPRTHGDSFIHVDRIDVLVPVSTPLLERIPEAADAVTAEIGRHVASLIPDGATLQVGIGKIPDAVLGALGNHHDLGMHTEMFSDGVMSLVEAGVLTGRRKTLLPGKIVSSFVMGTRKLYDWVDGNPAVELRGSEFTNDPFVISRNERMISINSALSVDLTGQVAADGVGGRFYSGIGGQVDFIRGAARSRGGKSIVALPSVAQKGTMSRICAAFPVGTGVVTSRGDVRYVVTEYGVADLWGKNIRERANALIAIAHPDHRYELMEQAKHRKYVLPDQPIPKSDYLWTQPRQVQTPDGNALTIRPARLTDERSVQDFMYQLSEDTVRSRYHFTKTVHPRTEIQDLVNLELEANMALVACVGDTNEVVGLVRYDVDPATQLGDVGIVIRDDWQRRGVGSALMTALKEVGRARGLAGFHADVLASNKPMLTLLTRTGLDITSRAEDGVTFVDAKFPRELPSRA